PAAQPSQASRDEQDIHYANDLAVDDSRDATQNHNGSVPNTVPVKPLKNKAWDGRDDRDDKNPLFSFCAHCGAPATANSPVQLCAIDGKGFLLHRDCRADWLSETSPDLSIPPFLQRTSAEEN